MWRGHAPYIDPSYEPVWAACAAHDMPVHTHSGSAPQDEYQENVGVYLAEVVWWAVRPMWFLLFGGAFERHPNLKFCITESAAYWAPDLMWKWDTYLGGGHTTKKLVGQLAGKVTRLPSEYFGTNVFIGASTMSREEIRRRYAIGTDTVMWGNDYPHPEGTWPHTVAKLKETFHDVPVEDTGACSAGPRRVCTASTPTRSRRSRRASVRRRPTSARTRTAPSIPRRSGGAAGGRKASSRPGSV